MRRWGTKENIITLCKIWAEICSGLLTLSKQRILRNNTVIGVKKSITVYFQLLHRNSEALAMKENCFFVLWSELIKRSLYFPSFLTVNKLRPKARLQELMDDAEAVNLAGCPDHQDQCRTLTPSGFASPTDSMNLCQSEVWRRVFGRQPPHSRQLDAESAYGAFPSSTWDMWGLRICGGSSARVAWTHESCCPSLQASRFPGAVAVGRVRVSLEGTAGSSTCKQ